MQLYKIIKHMCVFSYGKGSLTCCGPHGYCLVSVLFNESIQYSWFCCFIATCLHEYVNISNKI